MSKGYKEMEAEAKDFERQEKEFWTKIRTSFFDEEGYTGSDEDVLRWWNNKIMFVPKGTKIPKGDMNGKIIVGDTPTYKTNRPKVSHYQKGSIEPIDFINSNGFNFNLGNAIKYISRCNHKGSKVEDLKKAIDYINFELEN